MGAAEKLFSNEGGNMKVCIIGIGNLGSAIAGNLVLLADGGDKITMCEPHKPNLKRAKAEFWDLIPVANARGVKLLWSSKVLKAEDNYIITSGIPRTSSKEPKEKLLGVNMGIVTDIAKHIKGDGKVYVATNPQDDLAKHLVKLWFNAKPLRRCTDQLRKDAGDAAHLNKSVLDGKGYTFWTPGYAIAKEVMEGDQ